MRASIYARISSDREGAGLGVQRQEADCRELAASLGWAVVSVHADNDVSAYSGKPRPGYRALLDEIRTGEIDAVVAWHTDRLHRSPSELETYVALCDENGITTQTVKAGLIDLSTASGRFVARQHGSVSRYEVEHMVERIKRAKLAKATAGEWKGGRRPFGYLADGVTINPAEADALRDAAARILAGESLRGIARDWNAAAMTTSAGRPFDMSAVRRVLIRPRNAGLMEHQGEIIGQANWPAILPEEQWRALHRKITDPARRTNGGNNGRKWLGSGLYLCGVCGATVVGTTVNKRQSYRCRAGHVTRTLADVDAFVEGVIAARLSAEDVANLLAAEHAEIDMRAWETQAVALRARLDDAARLFADGSIDAQQLTTATKALQKELDEIRETIAGALGTSALAGVVDAGDPGAAWLSAPLERKRAVLDMLATVTLMKGAGGRPKGWSAGDSYFRPDLVHIRWRRGQ